MDSTRKTPQKNQLPKEVAKSVISSKALQSSISKTKETPQDVQRTRATKRKSDETESEKKISLEAAKKRVADGLSQLQEQYGTIGDQWEGHRERQKRQSGLKQECGKADEVFVKTVKTAGQQPVAATVLGPSGELITVFL